MPAKANSLKVTDSYRRRMVAIRERAKSEARKTWSRVRLSDLDATYNPGMLAVSLAAMQREAAQLSAGYLGAFIASETGSKIPLPTVQSLAGMAPNGANLRAVLDTPLIGVKIDIGEGMVPELALQKGGSRLVRLVGAATDQSAREALRVAMDEADEVEGYQRAVKGTCGACAGMSDGSRLPAGEPLEIHPDCQCVSEPVVARESAISATQLNAMRARVHNMGRPDYEPPPLVVDAELAEEAVWRSSTGEIITRASGTAAEQRATLLHELGHSVDDRLLWGEGDYDVIKAAIDASQAVKNVRRSWPTQYAEEYLLDGSELWARAYAQWMSKKLGDREALDMLREWGEDLHWTDNDFRPIAEAIERVFERRGWLN